MVEVSLCELIRKNMQTTLFLTFNTKNAKMPEGRALEKDIS